MRFPGFPSFQPFDTRTIPEAGQTLPGRADPIATAARHRIYGTPLKGPFPERSEVAYFAMGCFWGAERQFWMTPGVVSTAVGYAGGTTPNPTYEETCTGGTGHTEVVMVVFDPAHISFTSLLRLFWESHDPTQGMRQGNDIGTQYRSAIYTTTAAQLQAAEVGRATYEQALRASGRGLVTTEIRNDVPFYYAEEAHQQYLDRVPNGYCGLRGTGVACPTG